MKEAADRDETTRSEEEAVVDIESFEGSRSTLERLIESFAGWTDSYPAHQRLFPDQ